MAEFGDFAQSGDSRLRDAGRVYASIGSSVRDVEITVIFYRSRAPMFKNVWVTVRGRNPVAVNGTADEMARLLSSRRRRVTPGRLGLVLGLAGLLFINAAWVHGSAVADAVVYAGYACYLGAFYFWFVDPWLIPRFEIIDSDAPKSVASRLRGALAGSGRWLLAALAGAVIYAVVQKFIDHA